MMDIMMDMQDDNLYTVSLGGLPPLADFFGKL